MKIKIGVVTALLSLSSVASQIDSIHVENDIVTFKTLPAKTSNNISCVSAERATDWSISLKHSTGRAMYASLVAAYANKSNVEVTSANDCLDVVGVESVSAFAMTSTSANSNPGNSNNGAGIVLYMGDGATKIGPVIGAISNTSVNYVDTRDITSSKEIRTYEMYEKFSSGVIVFSGPNCTGAAQSLSASIRAWSPHYNDGKFFTSWSTRSTGDFQAESKLQIHNGNPYCVDYKVTSRWFPVSDETHPLCGSMPCQFKEN